MKVWSVLGYRKVQYTNKAGREVKGYDVHLCRKSDEDDFIGEETMNIFLGERSEYQPMINDRISIIYEPDYRGVARVAGVAYAD